MAPSPGEHDMTPRTHIVATVWMLCSISAYAQDRPVRPRQVGMSAARRVEMWLTRQDENADGKISLEESSGLMRTHFRRNDANDDGILDSDELGALANRLGGKVNGNRRQREPQPVPTPEQVMRRVPEGVKVVLDIAYREGNDAWKVDLAMPSTRSKTPHPAIVFVHGGGWVNGDKRAGPFMRYALGYAANGYVCISVNYRLRTGKRNCVEDVKCAVRWFRAHAAEYGVDPDRLGAYGHSAGAHLVTMLGVSHTEKRLEGDGPWQEFSSAVQAVVASATPTRPRVRLGKPEDVKLIQPMSYVSGSAPPMLLVHEESDRTVSVEDSDVFTKALEAAGAPDITYMRYTDGSGHSVFGRNLKETGPAMEAFFARAIGTP